MKKKLWVEKTLEKAANSENNEMQGNNDTASKGGGNDSGTAFMKLLYKPPYADFNLQLDKLNFNMFPTNKDPARFDHKRFLLKVDTKGTPKEWFQMTDHHESVYEENKKLFDLLPFRDAEQNDLSANTDTIRPPPAKDTGTAENVEEDPILDPLLVFMKEREDSLKKNMSNPNTAESTTPVAKYFPSTENSTHEKELDNTKSSGTLINEIQHLQTLIDFKEVEMHLLHEEYQESSTKSALADIQKSEKVCHYDEQSLEGKDEAVRSIERYMNLHRLRLNEQVNLIKFILDFLCKNHVIKEHKKKLLAKVKDLVNAL